MALAACDVYRAAPHRAGSDVPPGAADGPVRSGDLPPAAHGRRSRCALNDPAQPVDHRLGVRHGHRADGWCTTWRHLAGDPRNPCCSSGSRRPARAGRPRGRGAQARRCTAATCRCGAEVEILPGRVGARRRRRARRRGSPAAAPDRTRACYVVHGEPRHRPRRWPPGSPGRARLVRGRSTPRRAGAATAERSELEDDPGGDVAAQHLVDRLVDLVERPALGDDPGAARGVQLEDLGEVLPGADDRADDR